MKAIWAIGQLNSDSERAEAVDFVAGLGCDTIITGSATPEMVNQAQASGLQIIATVFPNPDEEFARTHPHCLQQLRDFEQKVAAIMGEESWLRLHGESFRWQSFVLPRSTLCFEHPEVQTELKQRVERALAIAGGVALDGFGFRNYYACFCRRCEALRDDLKKQQPALSSLEIMEQVSSQSLIKIHRLLYDQAKAIKPQAVVTNHVWPMFLPNERIGAGYKLDYCTQTISWFYPPEWPLERVEWEAAELKRLEDPALNRFVPFIGIVDLPDLVRSPERLAAEIAIAMKVGEGSLVLSRLTTLQQQPQLAEVVRAALIK